MVRTKLAGKFLLVFFSLILFLHAHEGHHSFSPLAAEVGTAPAGEKAAASPENWLASIGHFHLLFLHFPIALIVMTAVAELLWIWFKNPLFTHAARFMILAAAIFALPTALLGLALGYSSHFEGEQLDLYAWHRNFGLMTAGLAILTAILRERCVAEKTSSATGYYLSLFVLFIFVSLTGAFGGDLAFGLDVW